MLPPIAHNASRERRRSTAGLLRVLVPQHRQHPPRQPASPVGRDVGFSSAGLCSTDTSSTASACSRACAPPMSRGRGGPTSVGSTILPRTGRLQINLLDPEPGFFYAGTYLGKKKILSFGITGDTQKSYQYYGGDVFVDLPLGPGIFTAQVDVVQMTGGTFIAARQADRVHERDRLQLRRVQHLPDLPLRALWGGTPLAGPPAPIRRALGGGWLSGRTDTTRTSRPSTCTTPDRKPARRQPDQRAVAALLPLSEAVDTDGGERHDHGFDGNDIGEGC